MYVYDVRSGSNDPLETFRVGHAAPIAAMRFNAAHDAVISVDTKGVYILALQPLSVTAGRLLPKQGAVLDVKWRPAQPSRLQCNIDHRCMITVYSFRYLCGQACMSGLPTCTAVVWQRSQVSEHRDNPQS